MAPAGNQSKKGDKKGSQGLNQLLKYRKQLPELDKDLNRNYVVSMPVFENFNLQPGVSLNDGAKIKTGPKLNNLATFAATTSNFQRSKMQLSRMEYTTMTREGNHSRGGSHQFDLYGTSRADEQANSRKLSMHLKDEDESIKAPASPLPKTTTHVKAIDASNKVSMSDTKRALELLLKIDETKTAYPGMTASTITKMSNTMRTIDRGAKTLADEYNLEITGGQSWGRSLGMPLNTEMRPLPQSKSTFQVFNKTHTQSMGSFPRIPNPRTRGKPSSGAFDFPKIDRLPPPSLGETVGHGFVMKE
jgi:hypothetical protein